MSDENNPAPQLQQAPTAAEIRERTIGGNTQKRPIENDDPLYWVKKAEREAKEAK